METEVPALLRRNESLDADRYTFHAARMRMRKVTPEELAAMNAQTERASIELADLRPDVVATACLVAIMAQGPGAHCTIEQEISDVLEREGAPAPVVSSAGALVAGLKHLGARRIAMITPYVASLTDRVAEYIRETGIEVHDTVSLEVPDNHAVAALDPHDLTEHWRRLDLTGCDALVLSACVQMRSLESIAAVEEASGVPTLSASTATAWAILRALELEARVPGAGSLLAA
jgi:maleate isomerase